MKKSCILSLLLFFTSLSFAQKDVTKFLGIPVDGEEIEMRLKLIEKGYTYDSINNCLNGVFNGEDVNIYIVTNKTRNRENKVWRIMVIYSNPVDEISVKNNFNILCQQFNNNPNYFQISQTKYTIPEKEDISKQITLYKKRYEAFYYQIPDSSDLASKKENEQKIMNYLLAKYTQETLDNPTKKQQKDIIDRVFAITIDLISHKSVWFTIVKYDYDYNKYAIAIYYDNEYNNAHNGEDL